MLSICWNRLNRNEAKGKLLVAVEVVKHSMSIIYSVGEYSIVPNHLILIPSAAFLGATASSSTLNRPTKF